MSDQRDPVGVSIERAIREGRLSRRQLLQRGGAGAAALSLTAFLAACGIKPAGTATPGVSATPGATGTLTATGTPGATGTATSGATGTATSGATGTPSATASDTPAPTESASPTPQASPAGELIWANWPLYIDTDEKDLSKHQTLIDFTADTGIKVKYSENIQDNEDFFGTIQPDLAAGKPTPYDMIVMTDWMIAKMIALGYLEEINVAADVPNFAANAADFAKDPWYDPGNKHSVVWQSGVTGIGYDIKQTGREITSFDDLLDPKFKGKVGLFKEMRDTFGLALLSLGIKPVDATVDDVKKAQEKLLKAAEAGQFRAFYGNEYIDELAQGNLAVTMAWSGDAYQIRLYDNPDVRFAIPQTGGMLWTDNMAIPKGAAHPVDAKMMMDYAYGPEKAAQMSEYVGYLTPVKTAAAVINKHADEAQDGGDKETADQLRFIAKTTSPTPDQVNNTFGYKDLSEDEALEWNQLFNTVLHG